MSQRHHSPGPEPCGGRVGPPLPLADVLMLSPPSRPSGAPVMCRTCSSAAVPPPRGSGRNSHSAAEPCARTNLSRHAEVEISADALLHPRLAQPAARRLLRVEADLTVSFMRRAATVMPLTPCSTDAIGGGTLVREAEGVTVFQLRRNRVGRAGMTAAPPEQYDLNTLSGIKLAPALGTTANACARGWLGGGGWQRRGRFSARLRVRRVAHSAPMLHAGVCSCLSERCGYRGCPQHHDAPIVAHCTSNIAIAAHHEGRLCAPCGTGCCGGCRFRLRVTRPLQWCTHIHLAWLHHVRLAGRRSLQPHLRQPLLFHQWPADRVPVGRNALPSLHASNVGRSVYEGTQRRPEYDTYVPRYLGCRRPRALATPPWYANAATPLPCTLPVQRRTPFGTRMNTSRACGIWAVH
jgi:hypothetical protein